MTISTRHINPGSRRPRRAAFTFVEVMMASTLAALMLAGVLSAFLLIGRAGFASSGYSEMEAQTRRALEIFGNDVRNANDLHWNSAQSITLLVVGGGGTARPVTYAYDAAGRGATAQCFYRLEGEADSTQPRRVLVYGVARDFAFGRYRLEQDGGVDNTARNDLETKLLEISLRSSRTRTTASPATHTALSARYILRNKRVSN
jgi:Tfp pilus assembly protein PilW